MPYIGKLGKAGLGKEGATPGVIVAPTETIPFVPPDAFSPAIDLLEARSITGLPDEIYKISQGPMTMNGQKLKWEAEPENIGNLLMALFGVDTITDYATYTIGATNNKIDFKENGGSELHATIASATYPMGTSSAVAGSLCLAVKTALEGAPSATGSYTVTYSYATKKMTITKSTTTIQILWLTGTNNATGAYAVLGWTKADTADAIAVTSDSITAAPAMIHTFSRLASAQLPTYTFWFNKGGGAKYQQFGGCMLNKLDIDMKAKEFVVVDTDWTALKYDDAGTTQTPTMSPLGKFTFPMVAISVDSSPIKNYENIKVSFDNKVTADHTISQSIQPEKIYSSGFEVSFSMDFVFEDTTQYAKFLAGTSAALIVTITHSSYIVGTTPYALTLNLPEVNYSAAPLPNPAGLLKVMFSGKAKYNLASTSTATAVLRNGVVAAY